MKRDAGGKRTRGEPDVVVDAAIDALSAGNPVPPAATGEETALHLWAAEMLIHRAGHYAPVDDPVERDRVIREAKSMWGAKYRRPGRFKVLKGVAVALLGISIVSSVIFVRAQSSLPGDRLWKVKRWTEGAKQWAATGDIAEAEQALAITRERLREAEILIDSDRRQTARAVVFEFYREFEDVRFRLRDLSRERYPALFEEAEGQLDKAVEIDRRVSGGDVQQEAPVEPIVGTRSPTPRPPWLPASPEPVKGS
ncbi:MAG: hypothetical protein DCC49_06680 [Acidobacteria bacterium]|nr:MAG: hypothetical protein DCC49_06680 [Acidobacteriota bacterium]